MTDSGKVFTPSNRPDLHPELPEDRYNVYRHPNWFGLQEVYAFEGETRTQHMAAGLWQQVETEKLYYAVQSQSRDFVGFHPLANLTGFDQLKELRGSVHALRQALRGLPQSLAYHRGAMVSQAKLLLGQEVVYEDVEVLYQKGHPEAEALADQLLAGRPFQHRPSREHQANFDVYTHPEYFRLEPVVLLHGSASVCQGFDKLGVWQTSGGQLRWARHGGCPACDMAAPFRGFKPDSLEVLTPLSVQRWKAFVDELMDVNNVSQRDRRETLGRVAQRLPQNQLQALIEQMVSSDKKPLREAGLRLSRLLKEGSLPATEEPDNLHLGSAAPAQSGLRG